MIVVEIVMLIAGIWAIAAGKLPSLLFGGAKYKFEGRGVRLLGSILVLPLPIALGTGILLGLLSADEAFEYAGVLELGIVLVCAVAALIVGRSIRQPAIPSGAGDTGAAVDDPATIEAIIARKAQGSLIYALLGILGFTAVLLCPLAFIRANQALRLIDKHQVGERHRGTANAARILAAIIFLFYAGIAAIILAVGISGL